MKKNLNNIQILIATYNLNMFKLYDLSNSEITVFLGLLMHYNHNSGLTFPSQELLAQKLNMSTRSVIRAIKTLIEKNLIEKDTSNNHNIYVLTDSYINHLSDSTSLGQNIQNGCQNVTCPPDKMSHKHDKLKHDNTKSNILSVNGEKRLFGLTIEDMERRKATAIMIKQVHEKL